jgi:Flp pilus assembly protein TadG
MVEFALVLPIFMLILTGILDFGFMLYSRMSVINAAREGARAAVMASDPTVIVATAKAAAVSAASQGGITVDQGNVDVTCLDTHDDPTSTAPITCGDAVSGDSVKVDIRYSYPSFFPATPWPQVPLSSTVQMVIEY